MDKITLFPAFVSIYLLYKGWGSEKIFLYFFLPVLLLIPTYYESKLIPGFPEVTFWSMALLPVFIFWMMKDKKSEINLHLIDLLVVAHLVVVFYAQYEATGYKDAQKIFYKDTVQRLLPYAMIRFFSVKEYFRIEMIRIMLVLTIILGFFMLIEAKWFTNYLDIWIRKIWPQSVPWDGVMQRGGIKRAAATFGHPISAGYFFSMMVPFSVWYHKNYGSDSKWFSKLAIAFSVLGTLASFSRAPMMGLGISALILWFGWHKFKSVLAVFISIAAVAGSLIVLPVFIEYVSVTRATALTKDQENAAYRKEMLDNYLEVIKAQPYWGYGRYTFPVIERQVSIDNEYLFIALTEGLIALSLYVILIIWVIFKLIHSVSFCDETDKNYQLAWVLMAAWISAIFTQATVFAGNQTVHVFYMIAGLSVTLSQIMAQQLTKEELSKITVSGKINEYHFRSTL